VSPEAFPAHKGSDEFADDRHLVALAQQVAQVAELRGNEGFERAVIGGVYDP